jgi:predicted AlkP superfamily phosphohydrolase/phosphomutase
MIAGIPYPHKSRRLCWPRDLLHTLRRQGWDLALNASDDLGGSYAHYVQGLQRLIRHRAAATTWLMDKYDPDFLAVHFLETDQVQHRFWQFMEEEPRYDPGGPHTDAILRVFQEIDRAIAALIEAAGQEAMICVMSDHGAGPIRHQVWPNNWLIQNGYLALKPTPWVRLKQFIYRLGLSPAAIREAAPERLKLAILQFFERQKGRAIADREEDAADQIQRKGLVDRLTERLAIDFYDVDWAHTVAFSTGTTALGYIWLNVAGRQPQGIVQPGTDYVETREEIASTLHAWDAVGSVHYRTDLWHGAQLRHAPDLVIRWAAPTTDARYFQTRVSSPHLIKQVPNDYASHRPEGLFAFHGPHVQPGSCRADIIDLAPTLLWLLGQPVPAHMDGRVLKECFTLQRPIQSIDLPLEETAADLDLTEDDEAAIQEALRGLGYLD